MGRPGGRRTFRTLTDLFFWPSLFFFGSRDTPPHARGVSESLAARRLNFFFLRREGFSFLGSSSGFGRFLLGYWTVCSFPEQYFLGALLAGVV